MALRLFNPDGSDKPKGRFSDDLVGRFRSGHVVNRRPVALSEWRVTTDDPEVAEAIAQLLDGSEPQQWDSSGTDSLETFTSKDEIEILLDGPDAVRTGMALWSRTGKIIHACDGMVYTEGEEAGKPCGCPSSLKDKKDADKAGTGPEPNISIKFRLADDPDLGYFNFRTGSWSMAVEIDKAEQALAKLDGVAKAWLSLELVEYTTKAGRNVSYRKPVLTVIGPADDE